MRTHLDRPDPALDSHLDSCETCSGLLHSVAEDAGYVRHALGLLDPVDEQAVDVEAALALVCARSAAAPVEALEGARRDRSAATGRRLVLTAAAVLVVAVVALTPDGRSAVASTLDAFRGERLEAIEVDVGSWSAAGLQGLGSLERLGDVDLGDLDEPTEVPDLMRAEVVTGIAAPDLSEAPGLPAAPDLIVALRPGTARLQLESRADDGVPAALDGAVVVIEVPGMIALVYGPGDGPPELVVGRSGQLVVRAEGASLDEIRSFLLARDELPAGLRTQLADIEDWRSTIPVPVPVDGPGWEDVEIGGRRAIAFGDDTGLGALVLREDPDGVTIVGGRIPVSRALELAGEV